ncbi:MAG: NapC/NirT family cytochrome c [Holophaga sp.]|nr:NapC/NirT family cytochrome c [Holophaga sp.]
MAFSASDNWITILGVILTTGAGFTQVWSWFLEFASPHTVHPYVGIVLFMLLPMIFILGLLLIPAGILLRRRKLRRAGLLPEQSPEIDFSTPHIRKVLVFVAVATVVNMVLMGTATVRGVDYMDSSRFCGLTCHTPMITEYRAFTDSPHSRVGCAQCHIGPGTESFMRAKLAGVRQVFGVVFNTYSRPIPSPVETLRPARETCEACHWPQKFSGDKILVRTHYGEDADSTPATTVLMLKIGGLNGASSTGIHGRHLDARSRITYQAGDAKRETIAKVTYRSDKGELVDYASGDVKPAAGIAPRQMDCVDCHNRPTHAFEMPDNAVDRLITEGRISRELPFAKKQALAILKASYPSQDVAAVQIPQAVAAYYQASYPAVFAGKRALVDAAGTALKDAYLRNVSPEMKLTWGTHPNHIGHQDGGGCFRCHDGSHTTKDGRAIKADCDTCHVILAQEEKAPKILKDLGIN